MDYFFSESGPLAGTIAGYRLRPQQTEMAKAVAQAIESNGLLIAEAGTGTGKTFAYLVPALSKGGKVIVSTGTKTLQDQLFNRDIPMVRKALQAPVTVALLKGRANYICHYNLERARNDGRFLNRDDVVYLARIEAYAKTSKTGDRGALTDVPEDATVWPLVTSTRENCLGGDCPKYKDCFVMEARKQAMEADVVVVNHHLFFADVVLRDEGVAELLPACNSVIFDRQARPLRHLDAGIAGTDAARDRQRVFDDLAELVAGVGKTVVSWHGVAKRREPRIIIPSTPRSDPDEPPRPTRRDPSRRRTRAVRAPEQEPTTPPFCHLFRRPSLPSVG